MERGSLLISPREPNHSIGSAQIEVSKASSDIFDRARVTCARFRAAKRRYRRGPVSILELTTAALASDLSRACYRSDCWMVSQRSYSQAEGIDL